MSGGVDSSVAAHLLREQGHDVIGLFMRTGDHEAALGRASKTCCSVADSLDARAVADRLDIPFYALDFEADFGRIVDTFVDEYVAGRTPNPCVLCNVWLKFGRLWEHGRKVGADYVATGHYARIVVDDRGVRRIARGADDSKDQSYVLAALEPAILERMLLPIGDYPKSEIRSIARSLGLPVHDKADSQEICFIPDHDYGRFIKERHPADTSGSIVDREGREIGRHGGYEGYTIGQRKGLGIAAADPLYVLEIDPARRTVTVGGRGDLDRGGLEASRFQWHEPPPSGPMACHVQVRSRHRAVPAVVEPIGEGRVVVRFETPQSAITPGQLAALYRGEMLLGGGWIDRAID